MNEASAQDLSEKLFPTRSSLTTRVTLAVGRRLKPFYFFADRVNLHLTNHLSNKIPKHIFFQDKKYVMMRIATSFFYKGTFVLLST